MISKEITYTDLFEDKEITEKCYFHLFKNELADMELSHPEGLQKYLENAIKADDRSTLINILKEFIVKSYGVREGNNFVKTEEATNAFVSSPAFDELFMTLAVDADEVQKFFEGILPKMPQDNKKAVTEKKKTTSAK